MVLLFLFIFVSWGIYRYSTRYPEWVDDFISKSVLWLIPTFGFTLLIERKSFASIGLTKKRLIRDTIIGLVIGVVFSAEIVISKSLNHTLLFNKHDFIFTALTVNFLESFATGFVEEIVFRGYIQTRLSQLYKDTITPIVITSLLFVFSHFPLIIFVLHYSVRNILAYSVLLFVLGMFNGFVFMRTKSLTAPIIMHTIWDFVTYIGR